eukprot:Phypoly_transcript_10438.p1 GENE.Phypoly_transcript_10438~~Phypoly_transcript_10438.p1  ORF type:complete len:272 (+),score=50.72 Phypoly_transcript_10438:38-853(+)
MDFILMDVCRTGDVDRLNAAISEGVALTQRGTAGESLLHWAAEGGHIGIIKLLLQQEGLNINTQDGELATPLHWSCQENHLECSTFLLSVGANIDSTNLSGETPLHLASLLGGLDCVKMLIEKGANMNAVDEGGFTPLHNAVRNNKKEIAQLLISKGANYNLQDKSGKSARQLAYENGLFNKFDFLFETRQEIIDMFVEISRQNEKLQEERKQLQEEIARIKAYLQPNEAFTKNKQSAQEIHQNMVGMENMLQDCLKVVTETKNKMSVQMQ